ncbi:uncharacterized protein LOC107362052 isoform X2 [Tetranychus urticae]|uniref:uncharacterized protein LOC107362052 isoform X2 n=1 Tax=Tetranychus urticae TaxID=32264 RepID=UPI000D64666B|nr:uncharacterized protein LOC107362052 isoform X2 [Tetranychus urticae]
MLINEIPDDCLLTIFDHLVNAHDLINCYKGWPFHPSDAVYYDTLRSIDSTCLSILFTNLIIVDVPDFQYKDAIKFLKKQESLKGLINDTIKPMEAYCYNTSILEMLSVYYFNPNNLRNGSSLKQLDVGGYSLEALGRDAHYLPNLERLRIQIDVPDKHYDGPVLEKLKILELHYEGHGKIFYGFQLMDSCPNLQSAHIFMRPDTWVFDETLKHKCLRDLVIQYYGSACKNGNNNLIDLQRLLMKYPNLKHLALRDTWNIKDEHIEQLVHILPNLVLWDVRKCAGVTRRAADYVKDYCKRYGRSIVFYYNGNGNEIKSDWLQLSTKPQKISRGFDFMKHCFLKDFRFLSPLLIPIDY